MDKERQLEDALMLDDPITELTIAMEIIISSSIAPNIRAHRREDSRTRARAGKAIRRRTHPDRFVAEIKDETGGMTVTNVRDDVNIKLSDATAAELTRSPIEYDSGFTLIPGRYSIKFLARDDETAESGPIRPPSSSQI